VVAKELLENSSDTQAKCIMLELGNSTNGFLAISDDEVDVDLADTTAVFRSNATDTIAGIQPQIL
jgi:DNA mismatch repair ATPase MutL